jgi:uncharacterized phosphosugar-binding protein
LTTDAYKKNFSSNHRADERKDRGRRGSGGLVTAALRAGGVVQAFGSGHFEAIAMEIAGRALSMAILPMLVVYTVFQRQIQSGLTVGALK